MEKNVNIQQPLWFSFLMQPDPKKPKKNHELFSNSDNEKEPINILGLTFKYGIILQASIYTWMQNCIF